MIGGDLTTALIPSADEAQDIARFFRHASHPIRLQILCALGSGERGIVQLAEILGVPTAVISQHLDPLLRVSLLRRQTAGSRCICSLAPAGRRVMEAYHVAARGIPVPETPPASIPATAPPLPPHIDASAAPISHFSAAKLLNHAAHPIRLSIMFLLAEHELNPHGLAEVLPGSNLPCINSHLSQLYSGSLVVRRHVGLRNYYRLTEAGQTLTQMVRATCSYLSVKHGGLALVPEPIAQGDDALDPTSTPGLACLLRAFAHPLRLRLLNMLAAKDRVCDCHLFDSVGVPRSHVRYGLAYLKESRLISEVRERGWLHYQLAKSALNLHRSLIGCFGARLLEAESFRADQERLQSLSSCTVRLQAKEIPEPSTAEQGSRTA